SANIRIGLASQDAPFYVPHCIARYTNQVPKRNVQDQVLEDLHAIWDWILIETLHIPHTERSLYSAVLLVSETCDNREMDMGFPRNPSTSDTSGYKLFLISAYTSPFHFLAASCSPSCTAALKTPSSPWCVDSTTPILTAASPLTFIPLRIRSRVAKLEPILDLNSAVK
ncbi:Actin-related protein 9, partial [Cucurbita argyrosperma subsp. argyrosperma]